jgi:hypothetical protein
VVALAEERGAASVTVVMNSAYFIVPSGMVENFEFGSFRILTISSTDDFCFDTAR